MPARFPKFYILVSVQQTFQLSRFLVCLFDSIIYSNSYLKHYKKYNSKLNKNVILETFESNVRVLFRETYIRFDYKQWETCSETFIRAVFFFFFFFENIKIESNSRFLKFTSEFINGNKIKKITFLF